jgi:hypothetical protein
MECSIKNLYEGPSKCSCCINWVEEYPDDVKESIEDAKESKKHALLVRNKKGHGTERPVVIHSVIIQSPLLRSILENVFSDYPGVTPGLKKLTFKAPFRSFFYRLKELKASTEEQTDEQTADHLNLLYSTIATDMMDTLRVYEDLIAHGVITFDYVWTLFKPGELTYTTIGGQDRVLQTTKEPTISGNSWIIPCVYIDWDGKAFGWDTFQVSIDLFEGTKSVIDLEAYPLAFHPQLHDLKYRLRHRGQKFVGLAGIHYKSYSGRAIQIGGLESIFGLSNRVNVSCHFGINCDMLIQPNQISGRIVIDELAFVQFNPREELGLKPLAEKKDDSVGTLLSRIFTTRQNLIRHRRVKRQL